MDHSIHSYLRQAKKRKTNERLSKTQDFYIKQSYTSGKFAAIIATLNSFAGSTYIGGTQPVLYASRTFDILSGDPKNRVYFDMRGQAASYMNENPGAFTIDQTAAGKYLTANESAVIKEAIDDLNATLTINGLPKLSRGQRWTVEQAVWAVASENMVNANLNANPDVKFRVFAGTSMDDGSILISNEVSRIVRRNRASINGEPPSVFKGDPATALIDSTARLAGIYRANGIIPPTKKPPGLRNAFACHPARSEEFHGPSKDGIIGTGQDDAHLTGTASGPAGPGIPIIQTMVDKPPPSVGIATKTEFASTSVIATDRQGAAMTELKGVWDSASEANAGGGTTLGVIGSGPYTGDLAPVIRIAGQLCDPRPLKAAPQLRI